MKRVKGFNFDTEDDADVIEHIEKQGNQSDYIKSLVKKDMQSPNFEELVRNQVNKYLKETADKIKNTP